MLRVLKEQRINAKFLTKLVKSTIETQHSLREVYRSTCVDFLMILAFLRCLRFGEDIENNIRLGHYSISTMERIFDIHEVLYLPEKSN